MLILEILTLIYAIAISIRTPNSMTCSVPKGNPICHNLSVFPSEGIAILITGYLLRTPCNNVFHFFSAKFAFDIRKVHFNCFHV